MGPFSRQDSILETSLPDLRARIDGLNGRILALLQERAEIVLEVARVKQEQGLRGHDPKREEEMLLHLTAEPSGPFGPAEIRAIFKAIFRASLAIQESQEPRVAVAGTLKGQE
jgi:3-deoxy-7-phosphoheptulonate synthase / chorismate mutase